MKSLKILSVSAFALMIGCNAFAQTAATSVPYQQKASIQRSAPASDGQMTEEKRAIIRKKIVDAVKAMPLEEKQKAVTNSWDKLPDDEKQKIKDKIKQRWDEMPEDQKAQLKAQIKERWENLPQTEKDKINQKIKANIEALPEEKKEEIRNALKSRIANMSPEEKSRLRKQLIEQLQKADKEQDAREAARSKLVNPK